MTCVVRGGNVAAKSFQMDEGGEGDKGDEQNLEIQEERC